MHGVWTRLRAAFSPGLLLLLALGAALIFGARLFSQGGGLEARTERALSAVEGAGRVRVVIRTKEEKKETGSGLFAKNEGITEIPVGAVVVSTGAGDPIVRMQLTQAVCALLGLPPSSVEVLAGG